ncbi:MAG: response regulator [Planctomycetota bacterium]|nr:response regulator [Planctomycetota bacterium]
MKVVIVDDEPINIKVVRKYLKQAGYEKFSTTTEATEAVDMIRRELPDVILLDIMMPGVSGLEILEQVRAFEPTAHVPVLILTASSDQEIKRQALALGATDFLEKPLDPMDLVPRLRNVLTVKAHHDHIKAYSAELEREVQERTRELTATRRELIHCLARAAEYRDNETGRHVIRVGRFVGIVARELGLPDPLVELMELASPLHDLGKIGIPDSILLKPGKLTPEEFELMQTHTGLGKKVFECISDNEWDIFRGHTDIGAKILDSTESPLLAMAARIAITHHEKWNGSGYPLALAGEDIPIEGRITAVADVFDALSSKRPYKPAFPREKCLKIMKEECGEHFDPQVLDAFLARIQDVVKFQIDYAD